MVKKEGYVIDHINQIKYDNRKSNLRYATKSQNYINTKYKIRGVYMNKNKKWYARIKVNGAVINLGTYQTREEAVSARQQAEIKYFKDFSPSLNPIPNIQNLEELLKAVGSKKPLNKNGKISEDGWSSYKKLRKILKFLDDQNVIEFNEDKFDDWIDDVNNSDI